MDSPNRVNTPILSIVVPVRNHLYARGMLRGVLALPDPDIELVLHDASVERDLAEFIEREVSDPRLRYHFVGRGLSLYRNFNAAAELATGDYVCFVGEDDGVSAEIGAVARWASANRLDAVRDTRLVRYYWPDMSGSELVSSHSGKMFIRTGFTGQARLADVERSLQMLARRGGQRYLDLDLPKLYHGMVRRSCLLALKEATGEYVGGLTPDIYAAVALAPFVDRVATLDYPITIDGTASLSNAGDSARRGHRGELATSPHLKDRPNYPWPEPVPRFYSVETIWAESALVALEATGRRDLVEDFDSAYLMASCLAEHPDYLTTLWPEVVRLARSSPQGVLPTLAKVLRLWAPMQGRSVAKSGYRRLRKALHVKAANAHTIDELGDNAAAMDALGVWLAKPGRRFSDVGAPMI
jgi:hypothetical protein